MCYFSVSIPNVPFRVQKDIAFFASKTLECSLFHSVTTDVVSQATLRSTDFCAHQTLVHSRLVGATSIALLLSEEVDALSGNLVHLRSQKSDALSVELLGIYRYIIDGSASKTFLSSGSDSFLQEVLISYMATELAKARRAHITATYRAHKQGVCRMQRLMGHQTVGSLQFFATYIARKVGNGNMNRHEVFVKLIAKAESLPTDRTCVCFFQNVACLSLDLAHLFGVLDIL